MKKSYTLIDHTADMGIEVTASSKEELFKLAGEAFCDVVCDLPSIAKRVARHLTIKKNSIAELMQAFLSELLYLFDTEHILYSGVEVSRVTSHELEVILTGEMIDSKKHQVKTGIKAVTHHQLTVEKRGTKWHARVIFDV